MFLRIEDFMSAAEVQALAQLAAEAKFLDGRRSNPHNRTKSSAIGDTTDPATQKAAQLALTALQRSEEVKNFVFPRRMAMPNFARYEVGMKYGAHTDVAFLPLGPQPLRSDVSCTMFVSDPSEYEGGELAIGLGTETIRIKGKPGSAIFYPSTTIHEVVPVTSGVRLVMITFIESQIPDQHQRDLLYTLGEVRALEGLNIAWHHRVQLEYVIANLHRMWAR
jgi:PKHD-type hydroxylase